MLQARIVVLTMYNNLVQLVLDLLDIHDPDLSTKELPLARKVLSNLPRLLQEIRHRRVQLSPRHQTGTMLMALIPITNRTDVCGGTGSKTIAL